MNLATEGKINLLVIFIRFVTQSKLSLIFTKTLLFPHKAACFSNKPRGAYKNADGNSKFHITKLNPWKLTFWKQRIMAEDKIKVSVTLANEYKFEDKNFIILIFQSPVLILRYRSNHQRHSMKKGVLKNFTKFTEKHLCKSLF